MFVSMLVAGSAAAQVTLGRHVMASTGDVNGATTNANYSYTVGEAVIHTFNGSAFDLTQGFQQAGLNSTRIDFDIVNADTKRKHIVHFR